MPLTRSPSRRRDSLKQQQQRRSRSPWRGVPEQRRGSGRSSSPEYRTTCLSRPSRSPSPKQQPPVSVLQSAVVSQPEACSYYGTTQLERRSRSPSPVTVAASQSLPLQRLVHRFTAVSRMGPSGRRLPPVPGSHSPPLLPRLVPVSEYEQRSRSPSPSSSIYSLSSYYSRPVLPPAPADYVAASRLRYPVTIPGSGASQSRIGHAIIAPFVMSLDQPILQHIRLPSVSNSPTRPDLTQSPNDINFPRVCASPSHAGTPLTPLAQQQHPAASHHQPQLFA